MPENVTKTKTMDGRTYFFEEGFDTEEGARLHTDFMRRSYRSFIGDIKTVRNPQTKTYEVWWVYK